MSPNEIIRAWKDPKYRQGLEESERASLPPHPGGTVRLSDGDLSQIRGGVAGFAPGTHIRSRSFTCCKYISGRVISHTFLV